MSARDVTIPREALLRAVEGGLKAQTQLAELEQLREVLLALAQDAHLQASADLERAGEKLREYDQESERLLAESGSRVRSLRARIAHAKGSHGHQEPSSVDLAILEAELHAAKLADEQRVEERLSGREWIAREFRISRMTTVQAGMARLALSERLVPLLVEIARAGEKARGLADDPGPFPLGGASATGAFNGASLHGERNGGPAA